jgi:hypothetical protein
MRETQKERSIPEYQRRHCDVLSIVSMISFILLSFRKRKHFGGGGRKASTAAETHAWTSKRF